MPSTGKKRGRVDGDLRTSYRTPYTFQDASCRSEGNGGRMFLGGTLLHKQRRGVHTIIENVNITVPVVDPAPVVTPTSLNASSEVSGAIGGALFLAMIFVVMFTLFMVTRG
jgi:hypothetical protein